MTRRGLLAAGLTANILMLALALLDYARADSRYMWPIFIGWAVLLVLLFVLALLGAPSAGTQASPALARAVANLAHAAPASAPAPAPAPRPTPAALEFTEEPEGPFTFRGYTLHSRRVELNGGGQRTIWFFSKRKPHSGTPAAKPAGYHVGVNERTGLPFLKKGAQPDGEDLTPHPVHALRPQCGALTEDGKQCRNSARDGSKYCASHHGYQPPVLAKAEAARRDTRARVRGAPDTLPSVRKKAT